MNCNCNSLTEEQEHLLSLFIQEFLPMRGNKRKHVGNEIEYITGTLNLLFSKHFGYTLQRNNILKVFSKLGYKTFTRDAVCNGENKSYKPSSEGNSVRLDSIYSQFNCGYIYVDVDAVMIGYLRKSTMTLPPNTNSALCEVVDSLNKRILKFVMMHKECIEQ